jgi:hypothetical protein
LSHFPFFTPPRQTIAWVPPLAPYPNSRRRIAGAVHALERSHANRQIDRDRLAAKKV